MTTIFPFRGWRYDPGKVNPGDVVAPPYDVIDAEEQKALYARNDRNVVRLTFGFVHAGDGERDNRYARAATHLDAWREEGLFLQDKPAVYLYEQTFDHGGGTFTRRGFFARLRLSDWGEGGVYPHEKTLSGPKRDRLDLMRATRGDLEPIFGLLGDPDGAVSGTLASLVDYEPCLDVNREGVENRMWVVDDGERLHRLLSLMPNPEIFIADGHHRYETALAYRNEVRAKMREAGQPQPPPGDMDSDYIMMFIVPDSDPGLVIWPTHRLVHGLADFGPEEFLRRAGEHFLVSPVGKDELPAELAAYELPCFGVALGDDLYILRLKNRRAMNDRHPDAADAWRTLDVAVLHSLVMNDILGIDEGKLLRKENIYYSKSYGETLDAVRSGRDGVQCGFVLRETPMRQVRDIAEAGAVMPQKSTYFYPKPLSGTVFYFFW
ncbi:MAG: DUF1015 domain-containing protein [Planctomycetota bacterium]|jgi:uncharacterized protein (DUF1015 family)|nr:DUF1015 domain-containing protein [Planctomycetota bacterium]